MLNHIIIILVATSHPGNIGAAARAMKNMGLTQLRLVTPKYPIDEQAIARAAGAEDILQHAEVYSNLTSALADCSIVIGTSARNRALDWPQLDIDKDAQQILALATHSKVAILFGRESSGLTNEELQQCNYQVAIPANHDYSSLNLAAAVQVIAYELFKASLNLSTLLPSPKRDTPATNQEREGFYQHLEQTSIMINYLNPAQPGLLMPRFKRLFNRINLTQVEVNLLRGFLSAIVKGYRNDE